ncbi:SCO family protein [Bowmanella dokdonensis]|uniref:SCO family protein n=1 Tax=Bowmanella dokdonensis TaxID=751969 RepID=A0A939IKX3_9ALTE|nr:SCO family protein [Bowmanella dokdonensis]MBN7823618.1 SCO family protein [Bowmanella dokdonensis]
MKQKILIGLALILALAAGVYLSIHIAPPSGPQYASLYPQPREIPDFALINQHGETFGKEALRGKWTLAFTGYTFCPDICPTTLAELKGIYPQLQQISPDIQVLFLSVDPNRDTTERLLEYVNFFEPAFIAATAEHKELFPFVRSLGMMYAMSESTDNPDYLVDHSSSLTIINPQAQVVGRFKPTLAPGQMAVVNPQQILADMPVIIGR